MRRGEKSIPALYLMERGWGGLLVSISFKTTERALPNKQNRPAATIDVQRIALSFCSSTPVISQSPGFLLWQKLNKEKKNKGKKQTNRKSENQKEEKKPEQPPRLWLSVSLSPEKGERAAH